MRQTIIGSAIAVDPALVQDASYRFGPDDRRYIDEQIRGCERHLVDSLLTGTVCAWQDVDTASTAIAIGDAVVATTAGKVSKATSVLLAAAGSAYGVAVTTGAPGGKVRVAIGGRIPSTVTGLAAASSGFARVSSTGRLERVASYGSADWPVGIIADDGTLAIDLPLAQGGGVAGTGRIGFSSVVYVDKAGSDATAARGDMGKPFLTIAAALAAAQSGDVVRVGPGTWAERVYGPELAQWSLVGSGVDVTIIDFGDGEVEPPLIVAPQVTKLTECLIEGLTVKCPNSYALVASGTGAGIDQLIVRNVKQYTDGSVGSEFVRIGKVVVSGCWVDRMVFGGCMDVAVDSCTCDEGVSVQWLDSDTTHWGSGFNAATIAGSGISAFYARGSANVTIVGCEASGLVVDPVGAAASHGTLTASGCNLGTVIISAIADTNRVATLDGCHMASLTVSRASGTDDVIVSAVNATCVAEPVIGAGCDVDMRWDTPDGGVAVAMKWSGSQDSRTGEVVQLAETWEIAGETVPGQIIGLTLQGVTLANSTLGRVYVDVLDEGTDTTVEILDTQGGNELASGTQSGKAGGALTLVESMGSGVSGSITLAAGCQSDSTPYATLTADSVATFSGAPVGELGRPFAGVMYTNGASDGGDVWVVVAGKAKVLTYAGAAAGGYLYIDTARAYPDNGKADCELPRTTAYEDHGIGRALERVTSGLVLAQLDLRGFGPVLSA